MKLLWWTQLSLPATKCCNYSIVTLNFEGDKSRVFYCQFKSNSKTVSTKSNNIHVDSKLPNSDWITQTDIPHDIQLLSLFWGQSIDLLFISNVFFFQDLINFKRSFLLKWFANIVQSKAPNSCNTKTSQECETALTSQY